MGMGLPWSQTRWSYRGLAAILACTLPTAVLLSQDSQSDYVFRSRSELVLVNVTVRDKNGNLVRDLKREDFSILEDNKPQQVVSFDLENTEAAVSTETLEAPLLATGKLPKAVAAPGVSEAATRALKDHRLIVLFFDLSSMQPDEIDHAVTAADHYLDQQMSAADLVSVISLSSSLTVHQDFTSDKASLKKVLADLNLGGGQGFEEGTTGTTPLSPLPSTTPSTTSSIRTGAWKRSAPWLTNYRASTSGNR
jgi:VWFA-related protein